MAHDDDDDGDVKLAVRDHESVCKATNYKQNIRRNQDSYLWKDHHVLAVV